MPFYVLHAECRALFCSCKIDKVRNVIESNRPDTRNALYREWLRYQCSFAMSIWQCSKCFFFWFFSCVKWLESPFYSAKKHTFLVRLCLAALIQSLRCWLMNSWRCSLNRSHLLFIPYNRFDKFLCRRANHQDGRQPSQPHPEAFPRHHHLAVKILKFIFS
jgi:hypothetical protein